MYDKANYFAVLPAAVRYNEQLTARAKLLYASLTSITASSGTLAFPSNKYIAELFDVDERTAKRLVGELEAQKFITVSYEYRKGTKEILRRLIRLNELPPLLSPVNTQPLYAVIPSHILGDATLSVQAKLLYAEISAATPTDGYCSKPASFFAELLSVSEASIQRRTRELVAADALRVEMDYKGDTREIRRRRIYLTEAAIIVEKRQKIASDGSIGTDSSKLSTANDKAITHKCGHILGGVNFVTTSEDVPKPPRRLQRKRKKSLEILRL